MKTHWFPWIRLAINPVISAPGGRLTSHDNTQWERQLRCSTDPSRRHFKNDMIWKRKISPLQTMGISYLLSILWRIVCYDMCIFFGSESWDHRDFFWLQKTRQFSVNFSSRSSELVPLKVGGKKKKKKKKLRGMRMIRNSDEVLIKIY